MEKNKVRNDVMAEMKIQHDKVGEVLAKMVAQDGTGDLDPGIYAEYIAVHDRYCELDTKLRKLTTSIEKADKSDVEIQVTPGRVYPTDSSY